MGSGGERSCVSVLVCFGGRCDIPACGNDWIFGQILVCLAIQIDGMYWSSTAGLMMGLVDCQMLLECRLLVVYLGQGICRNAARTVQVTKRRPWNPNLRTFNE